MVISFLVSFLSLHTKNLQVTQMTSVFSNARSSSGSALHPLLFAEKKKVGLCLLRGVLTFSTVKKIELHFWSKLESTVNYFCGEKLSKATPPQKEQWIRLSFGWGEPKPSWTECRQGQVPEGKPWTYWIRLRWAFVNREVAMCLCLFSVLFFNAFIGTN